MTVIPRVARPDTFQRRAGRLFQEMHERAFDDYDELPPLRRDRISLSSKGGGK